MASFVFFWILKTCRPSPFLSYTVCQRKVHFRLSVVAAQACCFLLPQTVTGRALRVPVAQAGLHRRVMCLPPESDIYSFIWRFHLCHSIFVV